MEMPPLGRVYRAGVNRVVDADTWDVVPTRPVRLRLLGINSAELRSSDPVERAIAREQAEWSRQWAAVRDPARLRVDGRLEDVFGRELAYVLYGGDLVNPATVYNDDFLIRWGDAYAYSAGVQVAEVLAEEDFGVPLSVEGLVVEYVERGPRASRYIVKRRPGTKRSGEVIRSYDARYINRIIARD